MSSRVVCGFRGCGHHVAARGDCGRRLCPRNTTKVLASGAEVPWSTQGPHQAAMAAATSHDPLGSGRSQVWAAQQQAADLFDLPADTPLADVTYAVIDTETSALRPSQGHIVQVAVVTMDGRGNVLDRWSTCVNPPDGNVGRHDLHGVTPERAAAAPPFEDVLGELLDRTRGKVEVAHNHAFDRKWLDAEMRRVGHEPETVAALDTMQLARGSEVDYPVWLTPDDNYGRPASPNQLGNLCRHYRVPLDGWHDAEVDAEAAGRLLPHLLRDAKLRTVGDLTGRVWDSHGSLRRRPVASSLDGVAAEG